ncbi:MAG: ATP-binding cassette domain-containing protein [Actinomycetia bacterium]|nr:ATP-binding cassette domain-containing protein [Actinomycetes bacterium]
MNTVPPGGTPVAPTDPPQPASDPDELVDGGWVWLPSGAARWAAATAVVLAAAWLTASLVLPRGLPPGIVLLGLVYGSTTGLTAVGLILVWRANRVINFANIAIAGLAGTAVVRAFLQWDFPWWLALVAAPLAGLGVGALAEVTVIRRFANAPKLVLTVATIGLAQLLGGLELVMAETLYPDVPLIVTPFETPLSSWQFNLGPVKLSGNDMLPLLVVPVIVGALAWFMQRTLAGQAVRAAAENTDRARLLGIPVRRLVTLVWALAGLLAAATLVLRAPALGISPSAAMGPTILLPALAAAIVARMESMPVAFAAAMVIGVIERTVSWNSETPSFNTVVVLALILGALLFQRRGASRAFDSDGGWKEAELIAKLHPRIAKLSLVRLAKAGLLVLVVAAAVLVPLLLQPGASFTASIMAVWAIVGVSLVVLTGWGGQISLGQFGIVGAAAMVGGNLISHWNTDLFVMLAGATTAGVLVALLIGLPALRIQGPFLAVVTLAFAVMLDEFVLNPTVFPAIVPDSIARPVLFERIDLGSERAMLYFSLAVLAFAVVLTLGVRKSRSGRLLLASRDNLKAAEAASVHSIWIRLSAFMFAGALAGLAGGLHMLVNNGARAGSYTPAMSVDVFALTTIGGLGSVPGAVFGAGGGRGLQDASDILRLTASGLGVLLVLWLVPSGVAGIAARVRDRLVRPLAARHGMDLEGRPVGPAKPVEASPKDRPPEPPDTPAPPGPATPPPFDPARIQTVGAPTAAGAEATVPAVATPTGAAANGNGHHMAAAPLLQGSQLRSDPPAALLAASGVDVSYGQLQILFDVALDVADGEIVALLGTNGAGKSTILKAICGLAPHNGKVRIGDVDLSNKSAEQIVRDGVALMPGGKAIFPTMSVDDHLRLSTWTFRKDSQRIEDSLEDVHRLFPVLSRRGSQLAGDLSGGEQQQLAMAMTLMLRPRVMLIDELSLGLSPMIVAALCDVVRMMRDNRITIVVVEQSINVALTLAERAVFMEKGTVRFEGPTRELLERPDLLRSVFIEGAGGSSDDSDDDDEGVRAITSIDLTRLEAAPHDDIPVEERDPILVCSDLTKRFGGVNALSHVDLEVRPGEIVGLIGQNGAGKTTLMDCISGFHSVDSGRVLFRDTDITDWAPNERARGRLGRSFQEARLFPSLTTSEVIAVACERTVLNRSLVADATRQPASYVAEEKTLEKVRGLVDMLGLDPYANTPVAALSTGTRRIVELACLLAEEPMLMCLDEPSAGVAQKETEALGPLLRQICEHTGAGMLVIEHDMPLLAGLCDRLVAMELGEILVQGPPSEVLDHPAVIAAYLGTDAAAINRSGATVS